VTAPAESLRRRLAADGARLEPVSIDSLPGWTDADAEAALTCFRRSLPALAARTDGVRRGQFPDAVLRAVGSASAKARGAGDARSFFKRWFDPFAVVSSSGSGLLTGYYEPEVEGRLRAEPGFAAPMLARPADLVSTGPGLPAGMAAARRTPTGLVPYFTRAEIEAGALAGRNLEIVHLADPADVFFAQVQGSVRVRLPDRVIRLRYDGRNGHPYTAIGKVLVEAGLMRREEVTMQSLRAWLAAHPGDAPQLLRRNASYVFFAIDPSLRPQDGPRGALGIPLTPERSLAVDRTIWSYGLPFHVQASLPVPGGGDTPFARMLIAQDTGSAILGAARGDLFLGSGDAAGAVAGLMKAPARFTVLLPRGAPR
jgi:membrane-bound lytic murein transglycosylase A